VGQAVQAWTSMARLIVQSGHDIGNHTMTHPRLSSVSNSAQRDEIAQLDALVFELTGVNPGTIRPPYGDLPQRGIPDAHQRPVVLWSVDSFDWKKRSASRIARDVIDQAGPGDIILMHEISRRGVDALPAILEGLHAKGLTVVSVAQLLGTEFRYAEAIERVPYRCPSVEPASEPNAWCQAVD
jgi:peptidoglycan/xylan/chitin deacetylase (PgdA/CDA1 family)